MEKTLYLHIGSPKTGTSSLQEFLSGNHAVLRSAGIEYSSISENGQLLENPNDHNFVQMGNGAHLALAMLEDGHSLKLPQQVADGLWVTLDHYLASQMAGKVIISSEWFFDAAQSGQEQFRDIARRHGFKISILVWLRPQWEFFVSSFAQHIKVDPNSFESIYDFRDYFLDDDSPSRYLNTLDGFSNVFGRQNIFANVYNKKYLLDGDIRKSFLSLVGETDFSKYDFSREVVNRSATGEELHFLQQARGAMPSKYFGNLVVDAIDQTRTPAAPEDYAPDFDMLDELDKLFKDDNRALLEKYMSPGVVFSSPKPDKTEKIENHLDQSRTNAVLLSLIAYLEKNLRDVKDAAAWQGNLIADLMQQRTSTMTTEATSNDPNPLKVVIGKNGRLFLGGEDRNQILSQMRGALSVDHNDLTVWAWNLANRKALAVQYRHKVINVICPEPHVYAAEDLPRGCIVSDFRPVAVLSQVFKDEIFYPLDDIRKYALNPGETYLRTDSHWSDIGGHAAYVAVMAQLGLADRIIPSTRLNVSYGSTCGDLGSKLNPPFWGPKFDIAITDRQSELIYSNRLSNHGHIQHYRNPNATGKLLIFGTSFSTAWMKFFAESFGEVLYIYSTNSDEFLIRHFEPDYVIYESPERFCREPQSDRIRYPLLYAYFAKQSSVERQKEYTPSGISVLINALHESIIDGGKDWDRFGLPSYERIAEFLNGGPAYWTLLRDTRYAHQNAALLFDLVDRDLLGKETVSCMPQTCAFSLTYIRILLRANMLAEARAHIDLHFKSYGHSQEIEWYMTNTEEA